MGNRIWPLQARVEHFGWNHLGAARITLRVAHAPEWQFAIWIVALGPIVFHVWTGPIKPSAP